LCPPSPSARALLAVDGSQIIPDRHQELLFGLINIGSVTLEPGSGAAPRTHVETRLLIGADLESDQGGFLSEGDLALLRDAAERAGILRHAAHTTDPSIALTDGPLELWGAKDVSDQRAFERALREYLSSLRELERRGWSIAGYVDKPAADLVVRMLEISQAGSGSLHKLRTFHPLRGVSDRRLFGRLLQPNERSAVFLMQSTSRRSYTDSLAICFFYLNVGRPSQPVLARIEIPRWVANHAAQMNALHNALVSQCALLGTRPYPYILHRAHETARVPSRQADEIKLRLLLEMRRHGTEPDAVSSKSSAKSASVEGRSF
jgi:hypothetical protein